MSSNVNIKEEELDGLMNSGGLKEVTLRKRKVFLDKFKIYLTDNSNEPILDVMRANQNLKKSL